MVSTKHNHGRKMITQTSTLIVLTDYASLVEKFEDEESRTRWGVVCNPVNINDKWCLPLGWEEELNKEKINYTIEQLTWETEEI